MMALMRASLVGLLVMVAGACESSPKKLSCNRSIAEACANGGCALSWDQAATTTAFCSAQDTVPAMRADCGGYHVIAVTHFDSGASFYYDGTTGMLVAIVGFSPPNPMATCTGGPAAGFELPNCQGPISETLAQCLDGGTDGPSD
jgi:hypothetical protein